MAGLACSCVQIVSKLPRGRLWTPVAEREEVVSLRASGSEEDDVSRAEHLPG